MSGRDDRDEVTQRRRGGAVGDRVQGARHALRSLIRNPGFSAVVVGVMALGVGSNTAIFSVVDAVLLEPPPFEDPDRLVGVWESDPRRPVRNPSPADFLDMRDAVAGFERVSAYDWRTANLLGVDEPVQITYADVSADFFHTLGVRAALGRTFGPETVPEGVRQAVLSHGLWAGRFGADPGVVGSTLRLDDASYEVLGVMPEAFVFPDDVVLWTAARSDVPGGSDFPFDPTTLRDAWYHRVVARLAPGVSPEAAADELAAFGARLAAEHPDTNAGTDLWIRPLHEERVGDVRGTLLLLLGATGLVLLIVCANVANLLLVRAATRSREWAVRRALGAPKSRIVGQVLGESLALAAVGGVVGTALAALAVEALRPRVLPLLPPCVGLSLDGTVLAYSIGVAAVVGIVFGVAPAWAAASRAAAWGSGVDRGAGRRTAGVRDRRVRDVLVGTEVGLAVVLVLVSGLLLRSLWSLQNVDLGFDPAPLSAAWIGLPGAANRPHALNQQFRDDVATALTARPEVAAVAWTQRSPVDVGPGAGLRIRGVAEDDSDLVSTRWQTVSRDYFRAAGIPLVRGRTFDGGDVEGVERVAVVNEALVRRFFPEGDALGALVNTGLDGQEDGAPAWVRVVGVVADTRNRGPGGVTEPVLFRPMEQPARGFSGERILLVVRAPGAGPDLAEGIRRAVGSANPDAPVGALLRGPDLAAAYLTGHRLVLSLLGTFAGLALLLGAVGVYGVARYAVVQRTREIGVRMALGADARDVSTMVVGQGLKPAAAGVAAGLAASLLATRGITGRLFEVSVLDPLTWAAVPAVLLAVTLLATWLPARQAARVHPVEAIRAE
ncbi:MAG: ABC transporter permease [Longimicrobiales bacterium]